MNTSDPIRSTPRREGDPDPVRARPRHVTSQQRARFNRDQLAVVAMVAISTAIALSVVLVSIPRLEVPSAPQPAPDFSLPTDDNHTISLSDLRGQVVVINFVLLVCCSSSALEVGYTMDVEPAVRDRGVIFLSIAMDSEYNYFTPQKFRELMGFNWTLALDLDGSVQRLYRAVETSTFVIDRNGMIQYHDDDTTPPSVLSGGIERVI